MPGGLSADQPGHASGQRGHAGSWRDHAGGWRGRQGWRFGSLPCDPARAGIDRDVYPTDRVEDWRGPGGCRASCAEGLGASVEIFGHLRQGPRAP